LAHKVDYRLFEDELDYSSQTQTFSDNSIDFCLVDGQARDKCLLGILPKLKCGSILVIDNVNLFIPNDFSFSPLTRRSSNGPANKYWNEFIELTTDWRRIWTSNGVSDTCIYFKP
jgi:hypothetical protein